MNLYKDSTFIAGIFDKYSNLSNTFSLPLVNSQMDRSKPFLAIVLKTISNLFSQ